MEPQRTRLRHLRRTREIPLQRVARDTGINVATVSQIERCLLLGTPEQRAKLAAYFGEPEDALFAPMEAAS